MINMSKFFTYMKPRDKFLMTIGTISAIIAGFLLPCISLAMGAVTNTFDPRNSKEQIIDSMRMVSIYICLVGLATWLFGYIYYGFW